MRKFLFTLALFPALLSADVLEEVIVTGAHAQSAPPAQRVLRQADNLLLRILITNDAREAEQRKAEIHATLLRAIKSADSSKGISISSVTPNGFVLPLTESNYRIDLTRGSRPDTSQAYFRVRAPITDQKDAEDLHSSLKRFVTDLKMEGRTLVEIDSDVEVSIVNPQQYRNQVIGLMAEDVNSVTSALGDDYRVVLSGIDRPVQWARVGSTDVAIFIPYEYMVVPTSVSSIGSPWDY